MLNIISLDAVIGGIIGGLFTLVATMIGFWNQQRLAKQKQKRLAENLLRAIYSEIRSIWSGYYENIGQKIENLGEDDPFLVHYPMSKHFFTIYDGNSSSIGSLSDSKLRGMIITAYVLSKCMIDLLHRNNDLLQLYQETKATGGVGKSTDESEKALVAHAKLLMENHKNTKQAIYELEQELRKPLALLD